jgi:hypothetical protein
MTDMKNTSELNRNGAVIARSLLFVMSFLLLSACTKQQAETYQKAPNMADEAAAMRALQNIFRAETQYMTIHSGSYGTFDELVKDGSLDQRFAGTAPVQAGYVFTIKLAPDASGQATAYTVNADPKETAALGARHLYMDSGSNVIRANAQQKASTSDSPAVQ